MVYQSPRQPTRLQFLLSSLLLIGLSLALAPLSFAVSLYFYTVAVYKAQGSLPSLYLSLLRNAASFPLNLLKTGSTTRRRRSNEGNYSKDARPTVLVNGGRMQKCLFVARALARQGCRVVVVEERGWGLLSPARFSRCVDSFTLVPSGGGEPYIAALVRIAEEQDIDVFLPCSGAGTTGEDAIAAERMREKFSSSATRRKQGSRREFKAIIQDADLVSTLHEKDKFIDLVHSLDLDAPHSELVHSNEELLALLKKPGQPPRILKCAAELDDVGRSDLTTYPLLKEDKKAPSAAAASKKKSNGSSATKTAASEAMPDWSATSSRLSSLPIPISSSTPYIAQEFIGGQYTSEWCTHSTVIDGQVRAFVACPSNDMLMTYYPAQDHPIGRRALQWTFDFLDALKRQRSEQGRTGGCLDGHYSFDFIHQPEPGKRPSDDNDDDDGFWSGGRLVCIECNPRVHTAVGLISQGNDDFGKVYLSSKKKTTTTGSKGSNGTAHGAMEGKNGRPAAAAASPPPVMPLPTSSSMSWLAHDLPARLLPLFLPYHVRVAIHPFWLTTSDCASLEQQGTTATATASATATATATALDSTKEEDFDLFCPGQRDAAWDSGDPWPFWALYHAMWPWLMLRQLVVRRKRWTRINVSTARIFEC